MQGFIAKGAIGSISPYQAGKPIEETAREYGIAPEKIIKLASNENPLGMSPKAAKAAAEALIAAARYPDSGAFDFRRRAAEFAGVSPDEVIVGNGSDEILGLVARTVLEPGTNCVFAEHAFSVYELSVQENGAECVEVPLKEDFSIDLKAMREAVNDKTRLVFITTPNNPTGLALDPAELKEFAKSLPEKCVLVLDEAYIDYAEEKWRDNTFAWTCEMPNLMVTRTFSKAYGLAGLRAGFGVADRELIAMMNRIRPPFNMNLAAQKAAQAALDDQDYIAEVYKANREGVAQLEGAFAALGLEYVPTQANFILVKTGACASDIYSKLLARGIIIRPLKSYGLSEYLRVSVGTQEQNAAFIEAFTAVYREIQGA